MSIKSFVREIKNLSYDDIEIKVREATSNDPEGPSVALMDQIAKATYDAILFGKLFTQLWKRLTDVEQYLHVLKALVVVNHLLRAGDRKFIEEVRKRSRDVFRLRKYRYFNADGQNIAADANLKATEIMELLEDRSKLRKARKKKLGKNYSAEEEKEELKKEIEERKAKQAEMKKKEEAKKIKDEAQEGQDEQNEEEEEEEEEEEAPTEVREQPKEEKTKKKPVTTTTTTTTTTNTVKRQASSSNIPTSPKSRPASGSSFNSAPSSSSSSSSTPSLGDVPTEEERASYLQFFETADIDQDGFVNGKEAQQFFSKTTLHSSILSAIWTLSDIDADGKLNKDEFVVAMFFSVRARRNILLPLTLPDSLDYRKQGGDFDALLAPAPPDPGVKVLKANIILGRSKAEELKKEKEELIKQMDEKIAKHAALIASFEEDLKKKEEEQKKEEES